MQSVTSIGVESLGPHLAHLKSIQHLDLSYNRIDFDGAESLHAQLAEVTSMQHLDLSHNHIDSMESFCYR